MRTRTWVKVCLLLRYHQGLGLLRWCKMVKEPKKLVKSIQISEKNWIELCKLKDLLCYRSVDNVIEFLLMERAFRMKKYE